MENFQNINSPVNSVISFNMQAEEFHSFEAALARIIGAPKCSEVVVQCFSVLCGGNVAFLDGVEFEQLQTFLPSAVAKSVWSELSKREFAIPL
jgi:hypothetical protein